MEPTPITPRLHLLDHSIGQAYLWQDQGELTLIDAGWAGTADRTATAIRRRVSTRTGCAGSC